MNTLFELNCTKCGQLINFDSNSTLEDFLFNSDYIKDDLEVLKNKVDDAYLVYKCIACNATFKYSLEDLFHMTRNRMIDDVKRYRQTYVFQKIVVPNEVDPDNGMSYCGLCLGIDEKGNCFNDIIAKCPFKG